MKTNNKAYMPLKVFGIVNQLNPTYWPPFLNQTIQAHHLPALLAWIESVFISYMCPLENLYGIIHDKDVKEDGSLKEPHVHIVAKFKGSPQNTTLNNIASWLGLSAQYIEKPKSGRYAFDNMLAYLIHAKDFDKYQYSAGSVVTACGGQYLDIYDKCKSRWDKGKLLKEDLMYKQDVDFLYIKISKGHFNSIEDIYLDPYWQQVLFKANLKKVYEVFEIFKATIGCLTKNSLLKGELNRLSIYVTGGAGAGKTMFSQLLSDTLSSMAHEDGCDTWTSFKTAAKNGFDKYSYDNLVWIDDVRDTSFILSDWLYVLDPLTVSDVSARYNNKRLIHRVTIHSCYLNIKEFFKSYVKQSGEDIKQFIRRYKYHVVVDKNRGVKIELIGEVSLPYGGYSYDIVEEVTNGYISMNEAVIILAQIIKRDLRYWGYSKEKKLIPVKG